MTRTNNALTVLRHSIWILWLFSGLFFVSQLRAQTPPAERLPRELWIATISQEGIETKSQNGIVEQMLTRMRQVLSSRPDFICLPELFAQSHITDSVESVRVAAEQAPRLVIEPISHFSKQNQCYVICPTYILDKGKVYNSALVFDRKGETIGRYDKMHPTVGEMALGVTPGELNQRVIETDEGKIGIQICYDVEWHDGWENLRSQGAEIIFWPSAFSGGQMLRSRAWESRATIVSSTAKGASRIYDCSGEQLVGTSLWKNVAIASINLERTFLPTWPSVRTFPEIENKYGRKIEIRTFPDEEWSILESRSPDVKVNDILKEFQLETLDAQLLRSELRQRELR